MLSREIGSSLSSIVGLGSTNSAAADFFVLSVCVGGGVDFAFISSSVSNGISNRVRPAYSMFVGGVLRARRLVVPQGLLIFL